MKAVVLPELGGPEVLEWSAVDDPGSPGAGEVLIDVKTAGLNRLDSWIRQGVHNHPVDLPHVLGDDAAGVATEVGEDVSRIQPGDRVAVQPLRYCGECESCLKGRQTLCFSFGFLGETLPGVHSEQLLLPEQNVYTVPDYLSWVEAGSFTLAYLTAYRMLFSRADLEPGDLVLIRGIGGGVATAALQLAVAAGNRVMVTSHSDHKLEKASRLGAEQTVNYRENNVTEWIMDYTGQRGVDVIVDSVGAETWESSIDCAGPGARIVTCGGTSGLEVSMNVQPVFLKQVTIYGSTYGNPSEYRDLMTFMRSNSIQPVVDRVFPARDVGEAHEYYDRQEQMGKVVLAMDPEWEGASV